MNEACHVHIQTRWWAFSILFWTLFQYKLMMIFKSVGIKPREGFYSKWTFIFSQSFQLHSLFFYKYIPYNLDVKKMSRFYSISITNNYSSYYTVIPENYTKIKNYLRKTWKTLLWITKTEASLQTSINYERQWQRMESCTYVYSSHNQ
mgnify:CR=1 FL=1